MAGTEGASEHFTLPELFTSRLQLRHLRMCDAGYVQEYAGASEIAMMTLEIPHPYEDGMAEQWITEVTSEIRQGKRAIFGIIHPEVGHLIGTIGLTRIVKEHECCELGYWIGKPFWGQGYCTEAAHKVLQFAFEELKLNCVYADHFTNNPASGRVMEKLGMKYEGRLRQRFKKSGQFRDTDMYSILKSEFVRVM